MNKVKLYSVLLLSVFLAACSFGRTDVNADAVKKIKKVAVIMYTVPEQIIYKDDSRTTSKNTSAQLVEDLIGKNGKQAADVAVRTFTETLQKQGLPFEVMLHSQVVSNTKFAALYKPTVIVKEKEDDSLLGQTLSFLSSTAEKPSYLGSAPAKMNEYGLTMGWSVGSALTGKPGESEYIKKAIEALKVDAVLVVNDPGLSFSCEACVGFGDSMNGAASTASAFNATLITRTGPVMNIQEWFASTDDQAVMVMGVVDPTEHKSLFEEHGRRMAEVYSDAFKESMLAAK